MEEKDKEECLCTEKVNCNEHTYERMNNVAKGHFKKGAQAEREKIIKMFRTEELELFLKGRKQALSMWEINEMLEREG